MAIKDMVEQMTFGKQLIRLLLLSFSLTLLCAAPATADPIKQKIGVSIPLSGSVAAWGQDLKNILTFANQQLAQNKYQLIFEDDRCDGKTAVTIAQKLVHVDRVKYAIGLCSASVVSAGPVYNRNKVILMTAATNAAEVSKIGPYVFRMGVSARGGADKLAELISAKEYEKLGMITEDSAHAVGLADQFRKRRAKDVLDIVELRFTPGEIDFRPTLLRLQQRDIDSLFINTNTEQAFANIVSAIKQLQYAVPLFGAFVPGTAGIQKLLPEGAPEIVFIDSPIFKDQLDGFGRETVALFTEKYGDLNSADYLFVLGFEAFRALHVAIENSRDARGYLQENSFRGLFGRYSFDQNGDVHGLRYSLKRLRNGKTTVLTLHDLL